VRNMFADLAFNSSTYCERVYVVRLGKSDANRIEAWSSSSDRYAASLMCFPVNGMHLDWSS
jgi:hypothetical protein